MTIPSEATRILTTGDGRGFITVHGDDTVRFWELPKGQRPVSEWLALARFFAKGRGTGPGGTGDSPVQVGDPPTGPGAAHLRAEAAPTTTNAQPPGGSPGGTGRWPVPPQPSFRDQWLALRAQHPEVFTVSADEIDAWHRHEAWRCEARQDWSNAVVHLSALLETHPDSGDFLPRRAAAHVAWAAELVAAAAGEKVGKGESEKGSQDTTAKAGSPPPTFPPAPLLVPHWEHALADYARTLAWVERYPAIAKESRKPFVEKRREVYLKLGRNTEADADERELKAGETTSDRKN